jgi:6-phosphogluconolactonase
MKKCWLVILHLAAVTGLGACGGGSGGPPPVASQFLYASVYIENAGVLTSAGIYVFSVGSASGALSAVTGSPFAPTAGGGPIAITRDSRFLYSVDASGKLLAFMIQRDGSLSPVFGSPFASPERPEVLVAHPTADFLYASGASGKVLAFKIDPTSGAASLVFSIDTGGIIPYGAGITPDGQYYYQDSDADAQVEAFSINAMTGALTAVPGSPFQLPGAASGNPGNLVIDSTGKFLYVANLFSLMGFGEPTWAYSIDAASGSLTAVLESPFGSGGAGIEETAAIDASGKFLIVSLANYKFPGTNCLGVSSIDANTGALTAVPGSPFGTACGELAADPSGPYIYSGGSGLITAYAIDPSSGALTALNSVKVSGEVNSIVLTP